MVRALPSPLVRLPSVFCCLLSLLASCCSRRIPPITMYDILTLSFCPSVRVRACAKAIPLCSTLYALRSTLHAQDRRCSSRIARLVSSHFLPSPTLRPFSSSSNHFFTLSPTPLLHP